MIYGFHAWRRGLVLALLLFTAAFASLARAGTIEAGEFHSHLLDRSWTYNVYLPTGYRDAGAKQLRYPVLYLLHGAGGDRNDWPVKGRLAQTVDALVEAGEMPPAIIVMPDAGNTWYVDLREKMESAFFDELVPHVEKNYRALAARDARVIGGLSMGGYGALRYVLAHPEKFQAAALLSPAIYNPEPPAGSSARTAKVFIAPGGAGNGAFSPEVWKAHNYPALWDAFIAKGMPVAMYIDAGDDDEFSIEVEAVQFYAMLRRNRQPAELRVVDGRHEWAVWESTLGDALRYVFRTVRRPQAQ